MLTNGVARISYPMASADAGVSSGACSGEASMSSDVASGVSSLSSARSCSPRRVMEPSEANEDGNDYGQKMSEFARASRREICVEVVLDFLQSEGLTDTVDKPVRQ